MSENVSDEHNLHFGAYIKGTFTAVLATDAGRVGLFFLSFFLSRLSYLPFLTRHLMGDGRAY